MRSCASGAYLDHQLFERHEGFTRGLLVAFGQVLAGEAAQNPQVVVEVHQALQVERVVKRRAARVEFDETLQHHEGLGFFPCAVHGVSTFQLGLLRHDVQGGASLQAFIQAAGFVPVASGHFFFGLCIQSLRRPACGFIFG
jgi:hypothetical protein